MTDIPSEQEKEVLMDAGKETGSIHDAAPHDNAFGGEAESHVETELSQVEAKDIPNRVAVVDCVQEGIIDSCTGCDCSVGDHALQTASMEGANSLELLGDVGRMSLDTESRYVYMI